MLGPGGRVTASGQQRKSAGLNGMSGLSPKGEIGGALPHDQFVPKHQTCSGCQPTRVCMPPSTGMTRP